MSMFGLVALSLALVSAFLAGITAGERDWTFALPYAFLAIVLTAESMAL